MKSKNNIVSVITKRELKSYYTSVVSYLVTIIFTLITGISFYLTFFHNQRVELRSFFSNLPIFFAFTIPAITMRQFAEEQKSGSIETLMTLPVTETQVVLGKFFASWITSAAMLIPTLLYAATLLCFGKPDYGPVIGGYIGAIVLCAAFSAIGIFASSISRNQLISLFLALIINFVLVFLHVLLFFLPGEAVKFLSFFAIFPHFSSIARGILDTRDFVYFLTLTVFFILATIRVQESRRR